MTITIGRRELLAALGCAAAAWPPFVCAQPENKLWRIGFLSPRAPSQINLIDAFRQGMRDLGYVEGRTFLIEARYADGQYDRLPTLARELLELGADIILAVGSPAIRAAQLATKTVPIVMAGSGDPVAIGLVVSLARPGGNTTGSSPDISTKHLQFLRMIRPELVRVAVLGNPGSLTRAAVVNAVKDAARNIGVTVVELDASTPQEIERAFPRFTEEHAQAVIVVPDAFLIGQGSQIANLAIRYRMLSIMENREYVVSGGLMSYGPSLVDSYRRAATYVDKILKGAKPADLPVEQPTKFEFVINLKTATTLGLTIPPGVLALADDVIE